MANDELPSWRPGAVRSAISSFLDQVGEVPVQERLACFDNDGTLWCERPRYVQLDFLVAALRDRVRDQPDLGRTPEFSALLAQDAEAVRGLGLERIAGALIGLFEGVEPAVFADRVREFLTGAQHRELGRPLATCVYQPMLELIRALRRRDVTVTVVTGGGTEFVRAISDELYGVPPEHVVGTLIGYDFVRDDDGRPVLHRSTRIEGAVNEGAAKVGHIQSQLGRRPLLAAGNSGGDREMLEWAQGAPGPSLALLVDHDDAQREFAYVSSAETFAEPEPIAGVGARLGWTVVSMRRDWETVFAPLTP